ncbi:MAG: hypothetical protein IKH63_11645 [Prevotella sp.]|nr:hypothetical protein [Prevotella sp.]
MPQVSTEVFICARILNLQIESFHVAKLHLDTLSTYRDQNKIAEDAQLDGLKGYVTNSNIIDKE